MECRARRGLRCSGIVKPCGVPCHSHGVGLAWCGQRFWFVHSKTALRRPFSYNSEREKETRLDENHRANCTDEILPALSSTSSSTYTSNSTSEWCRPFPMGDGHGRSQHPEVDPRTISPWSLSSLSIAALRFLSKEKGELASRPRVNGRLEKGIRGWDRYADLATFPKSFSSVSEHHRWILHPRPAIKKVKGVGGETSPIERFRQSSSFRRGIKSKQQAKGDGSSHLLLSSGRFLDRSDQFSISQSNKKHEDSRLWDPQPSTDRDEPGCFSAEE